jgi:hypothetical protein
MIWLRYRRVIISLEIQVGITSQIEKWAYTDPGNTGGGIRCLVGVSIPCWPVAPAVWPISIAKYLSTRKVLLCGFPWKKFPHKVVHFALEFVKVVDRGDAVSVSDFIVSWVEKTYVVSENLSVCNAEGWLRLPLAVHCILTWQSFATCRVETQHLVQMFFLWRKVFRSVRVFAWKV